MKKLLISTLLISTLFAFGCTAPAQDNPAENTEPGQVAEQNDATEETESPDENESNQESDGRTSVGGIHLGDSADAVKEILGDSYKEEISEDDGFFGEGYALWQYEQGVDVIIGLESQKVLQMEIYSSQFETNRGDKVGDKAQAILEKYRSEFTEYEGENSDGKLTGWFETEENILLIFSFNEDHSRFNEEITADSKVEKMTLGYTYFFH